MFQLTEKKKTLPSEIEVDWSWSVTLSASFKLESAQKKKTNQPKKQRKKQANW